MTLEIVIIVIINIKKEHKMNIKHAALTLTLSLFVMSIFAGLTIYNDIGVAIEDGDLDRVQNLINSNKASISDSFYFNATKSLLQGAVDSPKAGEEIIAFLLDKGAAINAIEKHTGNTALHTAVIKNRPEIVELLLERGAKTDIENKQHMTAYAIALENNNQKIKEIFGQHKMGQGLGKATTKNQSLAYFKY